MEHIFEFVANHPLLVGGLVSLICLLVYYEMRKGLPSVTSQQLTQLVNQSDAVVIDVRENNEFHKGHIVNAVNIPFSTLKDRMPELGKHKERPVIIVDAMGQHGGMAGKILKEAGLTQVMKLKGGVGSWKADTLPLVKT
ncbi:MAG: rhodanese-like domain-containing protein [Candidatus Endonucleobacter bathymodioli]|uniref:Rhodanese-like domain-containing protein n=1 Tax=Candidatus Endonucleibacter bathymodioli TaxID=539814 RepID=A0AA90P150_9GAMM|nr:rhodanese-like domain-containing protein [Candidatus Endonucleobacter bathymodioli]